MLPATAVVGVKLIWVPLQMAGCAMFATIGTGLTVTFISKLGPGQFPILGDMMYLTLPTAGVVFTNLWPIVAKWVCWSVKPIIEPAGVICGKSHLNCVPFKTPGIFKLMVSFEQMVRLWFWIDGVEFTVTWIIAFLLSQPAGAGVFWLTK